MKVIKTVINEDSELNLIIRFLKLYLCINSIKFSDTNIKVLAYFILYGINQKSFNTILDFKILKSKPQIENNLTLFRKHKLIKKVETENEFNKIVKKDIVSPVINFKANEINKVGFSILINLQKKENAN